MKEKGKKLYRGKTVKDVARFFAKTVAEEYELELMLSQTTAMDDDEEYDYWEERILREPDIVFTNAFRKMLDMIASPQENPEYYREEKGIIFTNKVISVVPSSGFYSDLCPNVDVGRFMKVNVEYVISLNRRILYKKVYPQETEL